MKNTNSYPGLFINIYTGNRRSTWGYHWASQEFFKYNKTQRFCLNPKSSPRVTFAKQDNIFNLLFFILPKFLDKTKIP